MLTKEVSFYWAYRHLCDRDIQMAEGGVCKEPNSKNASEVLCRLWRGLGTWGGKFRMSSCLTVRFGFVQAQPKFSLLGTQMVGVERTH